MRRVRGRKWHALVAVAAAAWSGCSLTSLSGLSGGVDAEADAGPVAEAGRNEATTFDAGREDAQTAADGPADAGPFCKRIDAAFCEDFDDLAGAGRWSLSNVQLAAHGIDRLAFTSPPASLFATTQAMDAGETAESYRSFDLKQPATSVAYAFDVRVDARSDRPFVVATGALTASGTRYTVSVVLDASDTYVEEAIQGATSSYNDFALGTAIPLGQWKRFAVSAVRQVDGTYRISVTLDGVNVLDKDLTLWSGFASGTPSIRVGALYTAGPTSSAWAVRLDNVVLNVP